MSLKFRASLSDGGGQNPPRPGAVLGFRDIELKTAPLVPHNYSDQSALLKSAIEQLWLDLYGGENRSTWMEVGERKE